jgi:hypothetical protein
MPESDQGVEEMATRDEELPTAVEGDGTSAGRAVHRLRARWLEPSPPLAVDDEPTRGSSPDGPEDEAEGEAFAEGPAAQRVAH